MLVAGFFLLFFGVFYSQKVVWNPIKENFYALGQNPGFVPKASQLRPLLFGFDHFTADLFWLRTVQYAGSNAAEYSFDALPAYVNLVVDLDPHFLFPYHFAALVLPLNDASHEEIAPLLEKGIAHNSDAPEPLLDLAFFEYYYRNDLDRAIEYYDQCIQKIPDCPWGARKIAANLRAKKGKYEIALQMWREKLAEPHLSDQEKELTLKKIEESAKLVTLNCAYAQNSNAQNITDLLKISIEFCPSAQGFDGFPLDYMKKNGLLRVTEKTLTSPFPNNEFEIKEGRVGTRFW